jgi:hypothetical protein
MNNFNGNEKFLQETWTLTSLKRQNPKQTMHILNPTPISITNHKLAIFLKTKFRFRILTNYQELFAPIFECLMKPSTMKKRCLPLPPMVLKTKCNERTNHNKLQVELLFKKSHDFFWCGGFFFSWFSPQFTDNVSLWCQYFEIFISNNKWIFAQIYNYWRFVLISNNNLTMLLLTKQAKILATKGFDYTWKLLIDKPYSFSKSNCLISCVRQKNKFTKTMFPPLWKKKNYELINK